MYTDTHTKNDAFSIQHIFYDLQDETFRNLAKSGTLMGNGAKGPPLSRRREEGLQFWRQGHLGRRLPLIVLGARLGAPFEQQLCHLQMAAR